MEYPQRRRGPQVNLPAVLLLMLASVAGTAAGADVIPAAARLAATCTGCHGTNGDSVGDALPKLAGRHKDVLLASLKDFKSGERPATVMTQLTKGYTDEQLERLAEFFSKQDASAQGGANTASPATSATSQSSGAGS